MQCRDVEQLIETEGFAALPTVAQGHLADCAACSTLVADFARIVAAAHQLPAEIEPPSRVWVALRAQLEAEKIIREPEAIGPALRAPLHAHWWRRFDRMFQWRLAATAVVALLVFAAGFLRHEPGPGPAPNTALAAEPLAQTGETLDQEEMNLPQAQNASLGSDSQVDNALRENLVTLNAFIKECRQRLKEDPRDQIARDYLATAYQQKAELLAAMLERGRSVN